MKGGEACCLATLCLPLGFAAGRTPNVTVVNIERDVPEEQTAPHRHVWYMFDANRDTCDICNLIGDNRFRPTYAEGYVKPGTSGTSSGLELNSLHEHHWVQHAVFADTQYCDVTGCTATRKTP